MDLFLNHNTFPDMHVEQTTRPVVALPPPPRHDTGKLLDLEDEEDSEHDGAGEDSGRGASVQTT